MFLLFRWDKDPSVSSPFQDQNALIIAPIATCLLLSERFPYRKICLHLFRSSNRFETQTVRSFGTNQFIKVLQQLPITSFHAKRFENATQKYADNIQKVPVNVFEDGFKLEIVPYDIVRELMLPILVKNK